MFSSLAAATFGLGFATAAAPPRAIRWVKLGRGSVNGSAGETATVTLEVARPGRVSLLILDRDGFPVRRLAREQGVKSSFVVSWDGRDDAGQFVADDAYSLRV